MVYSFYVEIYYFGTVNKAHIYKSFSSTDQLEPYLKQIDITNLIEGGNVVVISFTFNLLAKAII